MMCDISNGHVINCYYKENGGLMDNNYLTIYNNIFEAIAQCEENNPLLLLEHNDPAKLRRTLEFILLEDDNGKNVIMPKVFPWVLYKGRTIYFLNVNLVYLEIVNMMRRS